MRKLFLTSNGLTPELSETFLCLLSMKLEETCVGYLPNETNPQAREKYLLEEQTRFQAIGIGKLQVVEWGDFSALDSCQIVYVPGGNTFAVLKRIRESGFDQKLKQLLANGKIYLGTSAGSIVMGTSAEIAAIGTGADENEVGLEDVRGLRHVPFMIAPHFTEAEIPLYDAFAKKAALRPIVALEDGQAIVCMGDRYKLIGPGKPHTWNSKLFR